MSDAATWPKMPALDRAKAWQSTKKCLSTQWYTSYEHYREETLPAQHYMEKTLPALEETLPAQKLYYIARWYALNAPCSKPCSELEAHVER